METAVVFVTAASINAALIFAAMFLTGLRTNFAGLMLFAVCMTAIVMFIPNIWVMVGVGTVALWVLTLKVTNAEGVIDVTLFVGVLNLINIIMVFVFMPRILEALAKSGASGAAHGT